MDEAAEVSRLLDILGNRNRRRIIELLRQKPCFVTEISETLMLSPKAVIDHLQMMEREAILSARTDNRRRKYYYLSNDILVDISLKRTRLTAHQTDNGNENEEIKNSVRMFGQMIKAHDMILSNLEQINHEIEIKIDDLARNHKDLFTSDREITVVIALSHDSLTIEELEEVTDIPPGDLGEILKRFESKGIIGRTKNLYTLRGIHAE
jgi:ArsR family transcriptional regulator